MATGLSSPLGVAGIILIIIGIIMAVIGIILLIANQNQPKPWYIWLLLIGGIILGIIGGVLLAIALSQPVIAVVEPARCIPAPGPQYVVAPQPAPQYVIAPQPIAAPPPAQYLGSQTALVGQEHFDPDPQTIVTTSPPTPRRMTVQGPYGPGGQQAQVSGVYTPPAMVTTTTYDIANHPVRTNPGSAPVQYATAPQYAPAPVQYATAPQFAPAPQYAPAPQFAAAPAQYVVNRPVAQPAVATIPQQQYVANPNANPIANPAPRYVVQQPAVPNVPAGVVGTRTALVGQEHFDPDPQQIVTTSPSTPRRMVVQGPYGPGGQQAQVAGVYTPPATVTTTNYDIANHPVRLVA